MKYTEIIKDDDRKLAIVGKFTLQIQIEEGDSEANININSKEVKILIEKLQEWINQ